LLCMKKESDGDPADTPVKPEFKEGADYYFEDGLMVLTDEYLRKRGYCCGNGCRHCPYPKEEKG